MLVLIDYTHNRFLQNVTYSQDTEVVKLQALLASILSSICHTEKNLKLSIKLLLLCVYSLLQLHPAAQFSLSDTNCKYMLVQIIQWCFFKDLQQDVQKHCDTLNVESKTVKHLRVNKQGKPRQLNLYH